MTSGWQEKTPLTDAMALISANAFPKHGAAGPICIAPGNPALPSGRIWQ